MTTRVLIQHITGSKSNQIEQFPLDSFAEISIGRDPASAVTFDAQRDDAVSRQHAVIRIQSGERPTFRIADLGSRNGTLVNGDRIAAEVELLPGDLVELGRGGPKFSFDVQPRPSHLMARTRQINVGATGATANATRLLDTADIEAAAMKAAASPTVPPPTSRTTTVGKTSVGRETVIGMLTAQRQTTNRNWMYVLSGALVLVGAGGGALYYYNRMKADQAAAMIAKTRQDAAAMIAKTRKVAVADIAKATAGVREELGISPQAIVQKYGNATVVIDVEWRLYDSTSGKPLFQMVRTFGRERLPCFVILKNGAIFRWLTTDDQNQSNEWIGESARGSGFVISPQGFILTNKHVAAGWEIPIGQIERYQKIAVFPIGGHGKPTLVDLTDPANASLRAKIDNWIPDAGPGSGGIVFRADAPIPVDDSLHRFEGRLDRLAVRFPGSLQSVDAHLVRASPVADVAEIKIDTQQKLQTVELAQDDDVQVGERVTVLGYPAFSTKTVALIRSVEPGDVGNKQEEVPAPTVTAGLISQISSGVQQEGKVTTVGVMGNDAASGDVYQLTVPSGAGNSGGPVFNAKGQVIGLFTYGTNRETTTYAVPIKFGRQLLQVQQSAAN